MERLIKSNFVFRLESLGEHKVEITPRPTASVDNQNGSLTNHEFLPLQRNRFAKKQRFTPQRVFRSR